MNLSWENVYIFISSTFNDMHAERDYLVKRVFPELSQWCEDRRLRLMDIDLRWGVTEKDSQENKRVVDVCLSGIDRCRPLFLCFLGQRRGWVPSREDIADTTFENFPKLTQYLGSSVTELEIIHALIDPMLNGSVLEVQNRERAFFFQRDDAYLSDITDQEVRNIYTNEGETDPALADREMAEFHDKILGSGRPFHTYNAKWDKDARTPELLAPGKKETIAEGRLAGFTCEGKALSEQIIAELKEAITALYPERAELKETDPLQKELDEQAKFLQVAQEGFIEREGDFDLINAYLASDDKRPCAICARAGMGKTSWLARLTQKLLENASAEVVYRFVGTSEDSVSLSSLLISITQELKKRFNLKNVPTTSQKIKDDIYNLLAQAAKDKPLIVIVDAINQLDCGLEDLSWIPEQLPEHVKLIYSFKTGVPDGDALYKALSSQTSLNNTFLITLHGFEEKEDRAAIVRQYLSLYLKELDDQEIETIISMEGSSNPLYLKVLLSELKVYGSHEGLHSLIETQFGGNAREAFTGVLRRLEKDPGYSPVPAQALTVNLFGWLSHSKNGLEPGELAELLVDHKLAATEEEARDSVNLILRQLRSFLAKRDKRQDFFYESFMLAARDRCSIPDIGGKSDQQWHRELALYFRKKDFTHQHKLSEQAYHYAHAGMAAELKQLLTRYNFLERRIFHTGIHNLLEDYQLVTLPQSGIPEEEQTQFLLIREALEMATPVITQSLSQMATQLFGRLMGFDLPHIQALLSDTEAYKEKFKVPWFKPLCTFLPQPGGHIIRYIKTCPSNGACMFRDRKRIILYATADEAIKIIEISTGKVLRNYPLNSQPFWICLAEEENVLAIRMMYRLYFLNLSTGRTYPGENVEGFYGTCFDAWDGKLVQTGNRKNDIRTTYISDIKTGKLLHSYDATPDDKEKYISAVVFDHGGDSGKDPGSSRGTGYLLETIENHGISVMDPKKGFQEIRQYTNDPENIDPNSTHYNRILTPAGSNVIITITEFDGLTFYDRESGKVLLHESVYGAWLKRYAVSPDNKLFVITSFNSVKIYLLETQQVISSFMFDTSKGKVTAVAFSSDNQRLYFCAELGCILIYDIESGKKLREYDENRSAARELFLNDDESRLVSFNEGEVVIWDLKKAITQTPDPGVNDLQFDSYALAPDETFLIVHSPSEGGSIWRIDFPSLQRKRLVQKIGEHSYGNVIITGDSKYFACEPTLRNLKFFDCDTGEMICEMAAIDAEGTGDPESIELWDPEFLPKKLCFGEHGLTVVYHNYGNIIIQDPEVPEKTKVIKAFTGNVRRYKLFDGGSKIAAYSGNQVYNPNNNLRYRVVPDLKEGAKIYDIDTMDCLMHAEDEEKVFLQTYELKDIPEFVTRVSKEFQGPRYSQYWYPDAPELVYRDGDTVYYYMKQYPDNRYVLFKQSETTSVCTYIHESITAISARHHTTDGRYYFLQFGSVMCPLELMNVFPKRISEEATKVSKPSSPEIAEKARTGSQTQAVSQTPTALQEEKAPKKTKKHRFSLFRRKE